MTLQKIAEERNAMQQQQQSILDEMNIPYSLVKQWITTERNYQIKLANLEAGKLAEIIRAQAKQIEDLKRGIQS